MSLSNQVRDSSEFGSNLLDVSSFTSLRRVTSSKLFRKTFFAYLTFHYTMIQVFVLCLLEMGFLNSYFEEELGSFTYLICFLFVLIVIGGIALKPLENQFESVFLSVYIFILLIVESLTLAKVAYMTEPYWIYSLITSITILMIAYCLISQVLESKIKTFLTAMTVLWTIIAGILIYIFWNKFGSHVSLIVCSVGALCSCVYIAFYSLRETKGILPDSVTTRFGFAAGVEAHCRVTIVYMTVYYLVIFVSTFFKSLGDYWDWIA